MKWMLLILIVNFTGDGDIVTKEYPMRSNVACKSARITAATLNDVTTKDRVSVTSTCIAYFPDKKSP
ncbi:MAG: hypothetical protein H8E36_07080 [Rhodospirillaceae bacterium]|jgi:hypothetical protein|nr:hypothetical protein [Rhodospirillaceae bacterium]MBL6941200.1 hypothetical protein [Rhodospirillales bacterium]